MRRLGPLLLVVILAIVAGVALLYRSQKARQQRSTPVIPEALPSETSKAARDWCWSRTENHRTVAEICAKSFREIKSPSRLYLEGVEVKVFADDGTTFDRIKTANAEYSDEDGSFYADGEVEITAGEPVGEHPASRKVFIKTSGLKYDYKTGQASTDRATVFQFEHGEGKSVGAAYEPEYRALYLRSEAVVTYRGAKPKAKPLTVETSELVYKEKDSAILVGPWYRLKRGEMTVEGGKGVLWLKEGDISSVEASQARGTDRPEPDRQIEYSAEKIYIGFGDGGEVDKIAADKNARVASIEKSARTTVTADHIDLDFELSSGESRLRQAFAKGNAQVESVPSAGAKTPPPPARVLRSDVIELSMQPGGREINTVETRAPGVIEFLPSLPTQSRRRLEADRISIAYAKGNHIRSLQATGAATRTEPPRPAGKPAPPPMLTWSKDLRADFDPARSELARLEQWNDFHYEQGDRQARSQRAVFQVKENLITLTEAARVWDAAGSLAADKIVMSQDTEDVTAVGNVASTREPERDKKPSAVLSQSEPFHAKAARTFLSGGGRVVRYEGDAVVWQGGNRIEAGWIEIDRGQRSLSARGNVRSRFIERAADTKKKAATPVVTLVNAPELQYVDKTSTARYRGGVTMNRAGMEVRAAELRGVFAVKDGSSELETAYADGNVRISQSSQGRTRDAKGEHAVYTVSEGKVVLSGDGSEFTDSLRGSTRGQQLTWFADNDRLLVDGREGQPAVSVIHRQ